MYNQSPGNQGQRPTIGTLKMEEDLAIHIRKALTNEESAPKQKHVRGCMLYTWDIRGSGSFWRAIKSFPALGDELVVFKLMIVMHKVIRQGHPGVIYYIHIQVLKDGIRETAFFKSLARSARNFGGYSDLIKAYVQFLVLKLDYHAIHPEFSGNFDYDEYLSVKGLQDPNEGYHTIEELIEMLGKIENLQRYVFSSLRATSNNEARISALVPLVEESYGVYEFLVSMLMGMHQVIGAVEILAPLRAAFKNSHNQLYTFYEDCKSLRYLTSLITIPHLSIDPPDFLAQGPPVRQPKTKTLEKDQNDDDDDQFLREQEKIQLQLQQEQEQLERQRQEALLKQQEAQRQQDLQRQQEAQRQQDLQRQQELQRQQDLQRQRELVRQRELENQRRNEAEMQRQKDFQNAERLRMEEERIRMMQQQAQNAQQSAQMELQLLQSRLSDAQAQLDNARAQSTADRNLIHDYMGKIRMLEDQVNSFKLKNDDETIRRLNDEVNVWKQKYEALAKLYSQLRKEHIDLLTSLKDKKDTEMINVQKSKEEVESIKAELKAKSDEMTDLLVQRDRFRNEAERLRNQNAEEVSQLKRELRDAQSSLANMSSSKGAEVAGLVSKFNNEKMEIENMLKSKAAEIEALWRKIEEAKEKSQRAEREHAEEIEVLKAGLDQTLLAFAQQQQNSDSMTNEITSKMQKMQLDHFAELGLLLDQILSSSASTFHELILQVDSPSFLGNQGATPEFVLSVLEKVNFSCSDFGQSLVAVSQGGDPKNVIAPMTAFLGSMVQLSNNVKGVNRLANDDSISEELLESLKSSILNSKDIFEAGQSTTLASLPHSHRPEFIEKAVKEAFSSFRSLGVFVERIAPHDNTKLNESELGDAVEQGMRLAARAIEDAAAHLASLMAMPQQMQVHSAILEAAMTITNAISNLIKCATAAEREIVAHGRGNSSNVAFYKKNNKWTEGLISAARSVAVATTYLVETADGLVHDTHSWEQLVVAAQEVSVATTQLVAASRVKAVPFSQTQDKLEAAAVSVREATALLVKAAKTASKSMAEAKALSEVEKLGRHDYKVQEMEAQVLILEIEKSLQTARYKLAEIRKSGYSS